MDISELYGIISSSEELTGILSMPESVGPPPQPTAPTDLSQCVVLYDYDGSVVTFYSAEDFQSLDEMPVPPHHDGLVFQGWNWQLNKAKEYVSAYGILSIGATYIPADGNTHVFVNIPEDRTNYTITLYFKQSVSYGVIVDWGDESPTETYAGTAASQHSHTYDEPGDYEITMYVANGTMTPWGNAYNIQNSHFFGETRYARCRQCGRAVWIGNGVEAIGDCAFAFSEELTSVSIPNGVTTIGEGAFYGCYVLKGVSIPDGVTGINDHTFYSCHFLECVSLPESIRRLGASAFSGCHILRSVAIPRLVDSFGTHVFQNCYSLKSVIVPTGVVGITDNMFNNCYVLESIDLPASIVSIGTNAFNNCCALASVEIPAGVTNLGINAFGGCYSLSSIVVPSKVSTLNQSTFYNCYRLSSVVVQAGVSKIEGAAFGNCRGVYSIHIKRGTPPTLTNTSALSDLPDDGIIYVPYGSLSEYGTAQNWSLFASRMREEL